MRNAALAQLLFLSSIFVAALNTACGGSSDSANSGSPPPASSTPPTTAPTDAPPPVQGTPVFHFLAADQNGSKADVNEIIYTDSFTVRVTGFLPNTQVTLSAHLYTPGSTGRGYSSKGTFTADGTGAIDTSTMPSLSGTWTGVDVDAIFWSATEGALAEGLGPDRSAAFFDVSVDGNNAKLASASLKRLAMAANVTVTEVSANGLVAELFMPAGVTDRIPVIAFGGSEGGISGGESYAMEFASWGYPTLAVAYFGAPGVPSELSEVPLEYFEKAFTYLDTQPETRKGKAIVVGGSRGGELALLLGSTYPNIVAGVIGETPSSYRWAGLDVSEKAAWTYQGKPLAFVPDSATVNDVTTVKTPTGDSAYVLRPTFEDALKDANPTDLEAARIRVEDIGGPILMLGGDADQLWPACDFISRAMTVLTSAGHVAKYADESDCFPNAGHAVGIIGLPTTGSMWADIDMSTYALGGTAEGNAHSGRAAETKIRAFLARVEQ